MQTTILAHSLSKFTCKLLMMRRGTSHDSKVKVIFGTLSIKTCCFNTGSCYFNFPFLSSNIPSSPAYGVFISQLIRYARASSSYDCFILRARQLSSKLLKQGYLMERLKSFRKFYGRYGDLIQQYEVSLSRMLNDILTLDQQWLLNRSDFSTNSMTFIPSLTFTELWVVSMDHLQRVWLANRERLPFRTPGSVRLLRLACAPIVETRFLELAMSLLDFSSWIPLGTFSSFLCPITFRLHL